MMTKTEFDQMLEDTERVASFVKWCAVAGFLLLLLYASQANAETYEFKDQAGNRIVLYSDPCPEGGFLTGWKKATFLYQGKDYKACWSSVGGVVAVLDSLGELSAIPAQAFRKMSGV